MNIFRDWFSKFPPLLLLYHTRYRKLKIPHVMKKNSFHFHLSARDMLVNPARNIELVYDAIKRDEVLSLISPSPCFLRREANRFLLLLRLLHCFIELLNSECFFLIISFCFLVSLDTAETLAHTLAFLLDLRLSPGPFLLLLEVTVSVL